jgi:hypothetical protein
MILPLEGAPHKARASVLLVFMPRGVGPRTSRR